MSLVLNFLQCLRTKTSAAATKSATATAVFRLGSAKLLPFEPRMCWVFWINELHFERDAIHSLASLSSLRESVIVPLIHHHHVAATAHNVCIRLHLLLECVEGRATDT